MSRQQKFFLLFLDFVVFILSFVVVAELRSEISAARVLSAVSLWIMAPLMLSFLYIFGAYDINHSTTSPRIAGRTLLGLLVATFLVILTNYFYALDRSGIYGRGILVGSMAAFGVIATLSRIVFHWHFQKVFSGAKILVVTTQEYYHALKNDLEKNPYKGSFSFLVNDNLTDSSDIIGTWQNGFKEALLNKWFSIVIALDEQAPDDLIEQLMLVRFESNRVSDLVQFYEDTWQKVPLYYLKSRWFLLSSGFQLMGNPIRQRLKRLMDVFVSLFILTLTFPIMILAAIAIKLESPGPVIYQQTRTGRDERKFTIFKFRSMRQDAEKSGAQWAQKNDTRVTRVGAFIRKTRIDELPQLFNILEGSMSFVGPRPERPEFNVELEKSIPFYNLRHMVQPGLTGWAQVLYPYGASLEDAKEKLQYDLFYIKRYSLLMDIAIILRTVSVVLFGRGR